MIVVADNGVLNAIDLMVDAVGADYLIERLQKLKRGQHFHVYTDGTSPYGHERVYPRSFWIGLKGTDSPIAL